MIPFMRNYLRIALEILDRKEELEGLTKTEIYKKIKGHHNYINYALDILWYFGWIEKLDKRGEKLKCLEHTAKS
ncbi:hypothetical protein ES708_21323 [subsurface metagenome]